MIQISRKLIRVDDRLIHGQVSAGWAPLVDPKYMIIADDEIAASSEDSELYLLAVPFEYEGMVLMVKDAAGFLNSCQEGYIAVVKTLDSALRLFSYGCRNKHLNIGGLHLSEGKKELNHYIFMNDKDILLLKELENEKVEVYIQDLPGNTRYSTDQLFKKWQKARAAE